MAKTDRKQPESLTDSLRTVMPTTLMRLEDRIVLDAAPVSDGDGGDHGTHAGTDHGPVAAPDAHAGPQHAAADVPAPHVDAPVSPIDMAHTLVERAMAALLSAQHHTTERVLIVSSDVNQAHVLTNAAGAGVHSVTYDAHGTSLEALLQEVRASLHGQAADSIALATHGLPGTGFGLINGHDVTLESLDNPEMQAFWKGLAALLEPGGRIDLLACNVAATPHGEQLLTALEHLTGANFAASSDATGNLAHGGDWTLESDHIDVGPMYFDAPHLAHFDHVLATPPQIADSNPSPNAYGGGGAVVVDPNITVTAGDTGDLEGAHVRIRQGFKAGQDVLSLNASAAAAAGAAGVTATYNAGTGELFLSGAASAAAYQDILRGVTYENTSVLPDTTPRDIIFVLGDTFDTFNYLPATGHYYELSAGMSNWATSLADSAGRSLLGLKGYLATVTSVDENTLISGLLPVGPLFKSWLGGTDSAVQGDFVWVTGPEAGSLFWTGGTAPAGAVVAGWYAKFPIGEPSAMGGRDYLAVGSTSSNRDWLAGSSVQNYRWTTEYGGLDTDSEGTLVAGVTVNVIDINDAPVLDNAAGLHLTSIHEDATNSAGDRVADIIASTGGDRITDFDPGAQEGIALIGIDADHGTWQFSTDGGATWHDIGGVSNGHALLLRDSDLLRFQPNADWHGTLDHGVTFRAWDRTSGTAGNYADASTHGGTSAFSDNTASAGLVVDPVNDAPVIDHAVPDQHINEDAPFTYELPSNAFHDVDGDALHYTATLADGSPLPDWLHFNADTHTFSGTPDNDHVGAFAVKVVADDGHGGVASQQFTINVANTNDAPVVDVPIVDQTATEDVPFSYHVAPDAFHDVDVGDVLSYHATLADGSPLPSWLTFDPTTHQFTGTPGNDDNGELHIRVTADDGHGGVAAQLFTLLIVGTNDPPTVAHPLLNQAATQDASFHYTIAASSFHDPDAGDTLLYSATRADGSPLPGWLVFDPLTRQFSGTPGAGDIGTLAVKVTVTDTSGVSASDVFLITVSRASDATPRQPDPTRPSGSGGSSSGGSTTPSSDSGTSTDSGTSGGGAAQDSSSGDSGTIGDSAGTEAPSDTGQSSGQPAADGSGSGEHAGTSGTGADGHAADGTPSHAITTHREREEEPANDEFNADLSSQINGAMFNGDLLNDEHQPGEFREAWNTIISAYADSGDELTVYLQSAFRTVTESALIDQSAETALAAIHKELELALGAGLHIDVDDLIAALAAARADVRAASTELEAAIQAAAKAGKIDRFDLVLEDVIRAALQRLMTANEHLYVDSHALTAAAALLHDARINHVATIEPHELTDTVAHAQTDALAEITEMRKSWDRVAQDVFAAFVKRLVSERGEASPPPTP